jgi:hypothetical protein
VDKVIQAAEAFQLPAPDFRVGKSAHRSCSLGTGTSMTWTETIASEQGDLSALLPALCDEPEDEKPELAIAFQIIRRQGSYGFSDHCRDGRCRKGQDRRPGADIHSIPELRSILGLIFG